MNPLYNQLFNPQYANQDYLQHLHWQQPAPGSKRLEGIDDQPQAAPFHEGHQHVDPVGAGNLLLQLGEHFRFMGRPGE